ncbi:N-acetyl-gamma-glutamyl-phosphate reductase [Paraburkholderia aspalathi]|nr:N-acetyl-gamma-glutamyl-phosphate reductase [Paraburkholderia aspalathi]MBK3779976.1 N-acetyl-gamma-glutamyl-phosphate reductase [Paraburkholderia aspalathi]
MSRRLFVDGASGTVGLAIRPYLKQLLEDGVLDEVLTLEEAFRKNIAARRASMAGSDIVLLCLPDDAARDAVRMAEEVNPGIRILDASAAHRCDPAWIYGLPEVMPANWIAKAKRVANPGCFATGCILLGWPIATHFRRELQSGDDMRPWLAFQGVTGYTAGGSRASAQPSMPVLTQLGTSHRHLREIQCYGTVTPTLTSMVGSWPQGMLVQSTVPLPARRVYEVYRNVYEHHQDVVVELADEQHRKLSATERNGTNSVKIVVSEQQYGTTVAAAYDNLGKGSAGAAAHNLRLMLT